MSKIERGQFSSFLRRYLGMTGVSEVTDELAPEISAIFTLEQERPEWEFLKGARLMAWSNTVAANAVNPSVVRLRNPTNSGVIAIVQPIHLSHFGGIAVDVITKGAGTTDLATVSGTVTRDTRLTVQASALVASFDNTGGAVGGNAVFQSRFNDNGNFVFNVPIVLTPGNFIGIGTAANQDFYTNFWWLEKRLDALEVS